MYGAGEYEIEACVHGYHVYQAIWLAAIGEQLTFTRKTGNPTDCYAVAVIKDSAIIGHLPKNIPKICSLFLQRGGSIQCTVSGPRIFNRSTTRRTGNNLYTALHKEITKLKQYMKLTKL